MKKLLIISLGLAFPVLSTTALANETVFSCFMKNGKHLSIQKVGNNFRYNYGHPSKPEMTFTNKISSTNNYCHKGACYLVMANKGVEYAVFDTSVDGYNGGGVIVSKNDKLLAETRCDTQREIYADSNYF